MTNFSCPATSPAPAAPLTYQKFEFSHADSRFEILTPTRITFSTYDRGRDRRP